MTECLFLDELVLQVNETADEDLHSLFFISNMTNTLALKSAGKSQLHCTEV